MRDAPYKLKFSFFGALAVAGFLLLMLFYGALVWSNELTDLGGDSAGYLLMARYYSPYREASSALLSYKSQIITPTLFPWILAAVDGGYNLLAAHLVIAFFALAAVLALYFWLRKELLPAWLCAIVALMFGVMPSTLFQIFNIWTEFPFIFFSLAAIAMLARTGSLTAQPVWYAGAMLVACASLIRVAALPLLAAFVLYLLFHRPRRYPLIALVAILPFSVWAMYSGHTETGAGSYVNHFIGVYSAHPLERLVLQVRGELQAVLIAWQSAWIGTTFSDSLPVLIFGFGLICIGGWLYRLKSMQFDAIYVALYLVVLIVWPHPEEAMRYSFVLYPILIAQGFLLLHGFSGRLPISDNRSLTTGVASAALILAMLPTLAYNLARLFDDAPEHFSFAKHRMEWYSESRMQALASAGLQMRLFRHLHEIDRIVPPGDCIFSIKPTVITLVSDRASYGPPKMAEDDTQFAADIQKCRFAYLLPFFSPSYGEAFYPMKRLGEKARVLTTMRNEQGQMESALVEIMH